MRAGLLTIAVVACLATGCTSAHHAVTSASPTPRSTTAVATPTPTPTPTQPTVPADVPTTGPNLNHPGEKPPVMPLLATQHTPAGAVAFAKFFVKTIDWGFATASSSYARHYFLPACTGCRAFSDGSDRNRRLGIRDIGGRMTTRSAKSASESSGEPAAVIVAYDITSYEDLDRNGKFITADGAHANQRFELRLSWIDGSWKVARLGALQ